MFPTTVRSLHAAEGRDPTCRTVDWALLISGGTQRRPLRPGRPRASDQLLQTHALKRLIKTRPANDDQGCRLATCGTMPPLSMPPHQPHELHRRSSRHKSGANQTTRQLHHLLWYKLSCKSGTARGDTQSSWYTNACAAKCSKGVGEGEEKESFGGWIRKVVSLHAREGSIYPVRVHALVV